MTSEEEKNKIRREVLHEVADRWQQGEWADAPRCKDVVEERIANANFVTKWLREKAENQEKKPG